MNAIELKPVPFHGETLFLIEKDGEPYTPARTFTENLGVAWQPQHLKLTKNPGRWGSVTMMVTERPGAPAREMTCIPIRKVAAWVGGIEPHKCSPEVRAKFTLYQNECDEALYQYWKNGFAVNPRDGFEVEPTEGMKIVSWETWAALQEERADLLAYKLETMVGRKQRRAKQAPFHPTNEMLCKVYDGNDQGKSQRQIARDTGIPQTHISYILKYRPSLPFPKN